MKKLFIIVLSLFLFVNVNANGNDTIILNGNKLELTRTYENGVIREKGTYNLNKERHGEWVGYYRNGQTSTIGHFKNDKKDGEWRYYDREGFLLAIIIYEKNRIINKRITNLK